MRMIDVQDHAYERNHPGRPWVGQLHGPQSANGEEMIAAIIVSTFNLYRPISIATTRITRWRCMRNGPTAFGS